MALHAERFIIKYFIFQLCHNLIQKNSKNKDKKSHEERKNTFYRAFDNVDLFKVIFVEVFSPRMFFLEVFLGELSIK